MEDRILHIKEDYIQALVFFSSPLLKGKPGIMHYNLPINFRVLLSNKTLHVLQKIQNERHLVLNCLNLFIV